MKLVYEYMVSVALAALMVFVALRWVDEPFERFDAECQSQGYHSTACQRFLSKLHPTDPIVLRAKQNGWVK